MKNRYFKKGLINIFITLLSLLLISCASGPGGDDEAVESVSLSVGSESIVADGVSGTLITATVKNTNGENAEGITVAFTTTAGTLSALSAKTVNGVATVTLTSPVNVGSASITGTSNGVNSSATVNCIPGPVTGILLTITPSNLTADGASESTVRAEVTDLNNNAVADGETVSFFVTTGTGILSAPTEITSGGVAIVTYTASNAPGVEEIRAEATNGVFSTATINLITAFVGSVELTAGCDTIPADGITGTQISATIKDTNGNNVADGTTVNFTTTAGTLSAASAITTNGVAVVTITSSTNVGTASIIATSGGVNGSTTVNFIPGPVTRITLTATPNNLSSDGTSTSTIRAEVTDFYNNAVADGETISFSVTTGTGTLSSPTATTTGGVATVTYTASYTAGVEAVTAEAANGSSSTATIVLITASIGSVEANAGSENVVADGVSGTLITATVKDTNGNNVLDGTAVTFTATSGDIDVNTAGTQTIFTSTTTNGLATATLTSPTNLGFATIIATSGGVNGSTTVNFIPGPVTRITLTATPNNLSSDGSSTSTIRAEVRDGQGNAVDGETISFSVRTGTGTLSSPTATTTGGVATVTYTASTAAGNEIIRAEATNGTFSTTTIHLVASSIGSVELTSGSENVVADGVSDTLITATVKDMNGNNVPNGTFVNFTTTAGSLSATSALTVNGLATTTLTSPANLGSATIIATSGGVNGSTTVNFIPGPVTGITLTATPNNLSSDGSSTSTIHAEVRDGQGNAVDGETISFSVTTGTGTLSSPTATTTGGAAAVTYTASTAAGNEIIRAEATNGTFSTTTIHLAASSAGSVNLTAGSDTIPADGTSSTLITATVKDSNGNNVPNGTTVSFTTTAGILSASSSTTNNGRATVTITSTTNLGTATIIATSGGVNANIAVEFVAGPPDYISVTAEPANLTADGTSTSNIRVTVLDANDNPVNDGETVTFSALNGIISNLTGTTTNGVATATYTAPNYVPGSGNDTITVETTNQIQGTVAITLIGPQIASIDLTANPSSLPADGSTQSTINAALTLVGGGDAPDGTTVDFSIIQGGGTITPTATTAGGVALAFLTSGTTAETAIIRAEAGGRKAEIQIEYTPGSVTLTIIPNSLLGTGVETATVTASLKDASGSPAVDGETVFFTLDDLTLGQIPASAQTSGGQGMVIVTFNGFAKGGTVTVTATWTPGGVDVTGSDTIDIQPPPAFIQVADGSPNPPSINIKGTGGQSTSQIVFDVKDSLGNLVADGYRLDFFIDSGPNGGEDIIPPFGVTHNGQVSTILYSGFKSGPVSIKATYYHDTNISTTTSQIAINAGPPVGEEFGIFAEYLNISGLWMANLENQISVNAADMYGNAIPDNTAISFKTYNTGGFFTPNTATTTGGLATNTLHSGGTYLQPLQGFVSVTGEAINGGRTTHITSIAIAPAYNNIIYAGTNGGGVYKSIDHGATWTNISRSTENPKYGQNWIDPHIKGNSAICIDPDDNQQVYAGTGYLGRGNVYRSLDGGLNWNSNNVEEWHGIFSTNQAVLTVLCDGGGSDHVWIGTEGLGALFAPDGENFVSGGIVDSGPSANPDLGDGRTITDINLSPTTKTETWTASYVLPPASATTPLAVSGNQGNGSMSAVITDPLDTVTENWEVTYAGTAGPVNVSGAGNGTAFNIQVKKPNGPVEKWTLRGAASDAVSSTADIFSVVSDISGTYPNAQIDSEYTQDTISFTIISGTNKFMVGDVIDFTTTAFWRVAGSVSGVQTNTATTDIDYMSDGNEVGFKISSGTQLFAIGDRFIFSTTASAPFWNVSGTASGIQVKKAYTGVPYNSDNNEVGFIVFPGSIPFAQDDTLTFHVTESGLGYGKIVRDMVKVPTTHGNTAVLYAGSNTGVLRSINGGQTWTETASFTGDFVNTLALHPISNGTTDIIYAGTEDSGFWVSTDSGSNWTDYIVGMGEGLSATMPIANRDNQGNGVMGNVGVGPDTQSEYWSVTCTAEASDGGTFSVTGTVSGLQTATATVGTSYMSDYGEISFTISDGSIDFKTGSPRDTFTFSTTRDPGRKIKDLLVDPSHGKLYAITYFWGPLEPHAVGNVYVHGINGTGSMTGGAWFEANTNLPGYDPPDDETLFAQHVMAADDVTDPSSLYIGGEGINLYKATSGMDTGNPAWYQSKSGLTNLIMARMPILFSGECIMVITPEVDGTTVTFTVYIQDSNGNPPIVGSTFKVTLKRGEDTFSLLDIVYPDTYTYQGTWRDPADVTTNNPYVFPLTPLPGDELTFTYQPTCGEDAPGCSGSDQEVTYSF